MTKPSIYDLHTHLLDLQRHYAPLRSQWEVDETFYDGSFTFSLPEKVNKIVPGTGRNAVDIPATHIVTDKPNIHRNREVHEGKRFEADDEEVEAFYLSFLQANDQAAQTPPLHEASKFQLLRGMGVLIGPFLDLGRHEDREDDALWCDVMDPFNVLVDPGPRPRHAFLVETKTVAEMEALAEEDERFRRFDVGVRKATDLVTLTQWYGAQERGEESLYAAWETAESSGAPSAGGSSHSTLPADWLVEPRESGYPYIPVECVLSGYGIRSPKLEKVAQSIFNEQVKTLLIGEAYALSVADGYMGASAFERYRAPNQESINRMKMDYGAGSASLIPDDVKLIEQLRMPDAILVNYSNFQAALETALFSGVVGGQRPKGVDTATGLAILSGQARLKFGPPLRFLEGGVARLLYKLGLLIEHNEKLGEFRCMGRTLTARQLHGDFRVKVELFSEAPEERAALISTGLSMAASEKGPSEKHISEKYWGIENYEEDAEQKMFEALIHGEEMKRTLARFLELAPAPEAGGNGQGGGGLEGLRELNAAASMFRAGRPGGLPQQEPLPGSPEMMAAQANQGMQAGQPAMSGAPGYPTPMGG